MKRITKLFVFMLILTVIVLTACGGSQETKDVSSLSEKTEDISGKDNKKDKQKDTKISPPKVFDKKSTFTYAISDNPVSLNPLMIDPLTSEDRDVLIAMNMMYSPLIRTDITGENVYGLATSVNYFTSDPLVIKFRLREDIKWSDGTQFTADDVVFTYDQLAKLDNINASYLWINDKQVKVEKIDDYNVQFILPEAHDRTIYNMFKDVFIIPKHVYQDVEDFSVSELPGEYVVTGPYKLVDYRPDEYLEFTENEYYDYYYREISIDTVVLRIIKDEEERKAALKKGEVDAANVSFDDIKSLDEDIFDIHTYRDNRVTYLGLNASTDELKDVRVRRALLYALDEDKINKIVYGDWEYYATIRSFLAQLNIATGELVESYYYNIDKARALLEEAGVSELSLNLLHDGSISTQAMQAKLIQEDLKEIGVDVKLIPSDKDTLIEELSNPDSKTYNLFLAESIVYNDPYFHKEIFGTGQPLNYFKYSSQVADDLFEECLSAKDGDDYRHAYEDLQDLIADEAIIYPLAETKKILAVNKRIKRVVFAEMAPMYSLKDMGQLEIEE